VLWGSGIMKDTLTLAGINYIIYCLYFSVFKGKYSAKLVVGAVVAAIIVFLLKGYVILAFIPAVLFGLNRALKTSIKGVVVRGLLSFVFFIGIIGVLYLGPRYLEDTSSKYQTESLESRVRGFHTWHSDLGGSTYSLGDVDYTIPGVIRKIPAALNVTFFRPYLWESGNPAVLVSALESTFLLGLFLYILVTLRSKFFRFSREKPILVVFVIYCLIFGFAVGFTSYNFGALVRYKIPIFSLFVFVLLYLYQREKAP